MFGTIKLLQGAAVMALLCGPFVSGAQASITSEPEFKAHVAKIEARYKPRLDKLAAEGRRLGEDVPSGTEIILDTKMETVEVKLHVPEVTMRLQTWKLHIPEVTMKIRTFSWHVPEVKMVMKDLGIMKTKVPEVRMSRKEWKTKIPEVTMRLQTWKLHIPEVVMKLRSFSFDVPKVGAAKADVKARAKRGSAIAVESEKLASEMQAEISIATKDFLGNLRSQMTKQFDVAISDFDRAIAASPNDPAIRKDLEAKRNEVVNDRSKALAEMDAQLAKLH